MNKGGVIVKTKSIIDLVDLCDGKYESIKELTLNRFNIVGEINNIDFEDLIYLINLEKLTLINLVIDEKKLHILTKLNKLVDLSFINCEIICELFLFNNLHLKRLIVDNTNLVEYINSNVFDFLEIKNMNINCENLTTNTLKVDKSDININTINLHNIKKLIISKKQYENNKDLFINNNIHLIVKDDKYDEVISEYENI